MNSKMISYSGKNVYVGIDVHKETYSFTCIVDNQIVKKATVKAEPKVFSQSLVNWFDGANIRSAYEAGFSSFVLHRALAAVGITNIVVNPASIPVAANDKVKTDLRDSKKIASELSVDRLRGIYVPTLEEELSRLLQRTRAQIVEGRAVLSRQIKSKLHQFGFIPLGSKRLISNRYIRELEASSLPIELKTCLSLLFEHWRFTTLQLLKIRRQMREQAQANEKLEKIYRSVPGIGEVVARTFATELGDMSRFSNERALFSFTGLTPCEYSSGASVRRGHISRQGASRIRKLLIESSWRALSKDEALSEIFERIAKTRGKKRAIVAVARRLIGRIRSCLRTGTLYAIGTYA
jgi:transposase